MKYYAGIGARNTPPEILNIMTKTAMLLAEDGYICKTGAAKGADQAFGNGAGDDLELYLPWATYEKEWIESLQFPGITVVNKTLDAFAFASVQVYHPAPENLKISVTAMHARNYRVVKGSRFVICWTPNGSETGGTGQAIRIALANNIHIYNLGIASTLKAFQDKIKERA